VNTSPPHIPPHAYTYVGSARPELASCAKSKKSWMTASAPIHKSHKKKKLLKSWKLADTGLRSFTWVTSFDPVLPDSVRYTEKVKSHCYRQGYHWSRTKNKDGCGKFDYITSKESNCFCLHDWRQTICLSIYLKRNHLLQQCRILDFLLRIVTENVFFAFLFFDSIEC